MTFHSSEMALCKETTIRILWPGHTRFVYLITWGILIGSAITLGTGLAKAIPAFGDAQGNFQNGVAFVPLLNFMT